MISGEVNSWPVSWLVIKNWNFYFNISKKVLFIQNHCTCTPKDDECFQEIREKANSQSNFSFLWTNFGCEKSLEFFEKEHSTKIWFKKKWWKLKLIKSLAIWWKKNLLNRIKFEGASVRSKKKNPFRHQQVFSELNSFCQLVIQSL